MSAHESLFEIVFSYTYPKGLKLYYNDAEHTTVYDLRKLKGNNARRALQQDPQGHRKRERLKEICMMTVLKEGINKRKIIDRTESRSAEQARWRQFEKSPMF